jgi:hypothetical protein
MTLSVKILQETQKLLKIPRLVLSLAVPANARFHCQPISIRDHSLTAVTQCGTDYFPINCFHRRSRPSLQVSVHQQQQYQQITAHSMYSLSVAYGTPQTSSISDRQQAQEQVLEVAMPGKLPTPFLTWGLQQHSNHRYSQEPQKLKGSAMRATGIPCA